MNFWTLISKPFFTPKFTECPFKKERLLDYENHTAHPSFKKRLNDHTSRVFRLE